MFTQADIDTIDRALVDNVKRVTFSDGRSVEYRDIGDMLKARDTILRGLAVGPRTTFATVRKS